MRLRLVGSILMISLLSTNLVKAQNSEQTYQPAYPGMKNQQHESFLFMQLSNLRELHESSIFLLKRYATLEAIITAVERGEKENDAFWIGTSSLLPGVGQMINEDYLQGGLLLFVAGMSWGTVGQLEFTRKRQPENQSLLPFYYSALVLRNGIMTYAMLHATNCSYREQRDRTAALWTGMASMVPGVGQAINSDWWEAGGLFVAWSAATVLTYYLENSIYISGDEGYLVESEDCEWSVAWLPGGAGLLFRTTW
ncbi:hypothetical protein KAR34_12565 [bacterium]|nr:hypothetical protein [bacterium]